MVFIVFFCMLGNQQGHLSTNFSQNADCARDASTSPTKNHAPA